jgi:hypothetical protein
VKALLLGVSALGRGKRFVEAAELVMSRKPERAVASTLGVCDSFATGSVATGNVATGSAASPMLTMKFCGGHCSLRIVFEVLSSSRGCSVASGGLGIRAVTGLEFETVVTVSLERS